MPRCQSPDTQLRNSKSYEGPNGIADASPREHPFARSPDDSADASHREHPSTRSLNAYAMTANGGTILCNRPDARVAGPNALK